MQQNAYILTLKKGNKLNLITSLRIRLQNSKVPTFSPFLGTIKNQMELNIDAKLATKLSKSLSLRRASRLSLSGTTQFRVVNVGAV